MLKSDEMLIKINNKIEECKVLEGQAKVDLFEEIKNLKNDYKIQQELEAEELSAIENKIIEKKEVNKMENKERMELIKNEEKVFANYVRTAIKNDMTAGSNGALIPVSISERIIKKVEEISPIYARATKFNVKGDLVFVKEANRPTCDYMTEMTAVTATDATFTTVKLEAFVASALTKVSRSLINRSDFDLVSYVVDAMARSIAVFLEKELIVGTTSKINGLGKAVTAGTVASLSADALIDLQMGIKSALQGGCEFLMNPADVKTVRKLKDSTGAYIFQQDPTAEFGYRLLGKNVVMSDQCPALTVYYGDFSGLYVKLANDVEVNVLLEKYADQYAVGILGFVELDADVVEGQKIVAIKATA